MAPRETTMKHFPRALPPYRADDADPGTAVATAGPDAVAGGPSPFAPARSTEAPEPTPAPSARPGSTARKSLPQRKHQQQQDQCDEDERQIAADSQELQDVHPVRGRRDRRAYGCVEYLPCRVMDVLFDPGGRHVAGWRHRHGFPGPEDDRAEHAPDRLGEACGGVLRGGRWIGKSAIPGRTAARPAGGEAMYRHRHDPGGCRDE